MELEQATQMLGWLDEERRRDKAELTRLKQQAESQAEKLEAQTKRIKDLEGRLTGAQAQLAKLSRMDEFLQQFKDEVKLMLERRDEQRKKAEAEAVRLRRMERESQAKALAKMKKELQRLSRHEEELQARRAEERRLNEVLMNLQQKVADLTKEGERCTNDLATKLELLEREKQRHKQQLDKLLSSELRREQMALMETQRLNELRRQKKMKAWAEEVEKWQEQMGEYKERFQRLGELYHKNQRVLEGLKKFEERMEQKQAEVAELQRLAEGRMRGSMEEWREEDRKRWRKQLTLWEHKWGEQKRHNEELRDWLERLEEQSQKNQSQILALWRVWQESVLRQMAELEKQIVEAEEYASGS